MGVDIMFPQCGVALCSSVRNVATWSEPLRDSAADSQLSAATKPSAALVARSLTKLLALLVASAVSMAGQRAPRPVFEVESNLVPISAQVIDRETGQPVTGLKRSDFQVLDESLPSELVVFDDSPAQLDILLLVDVSGGYTNQHINSCSLALRRSLTAWDRIGLMSFSDGAFRKRADFTNDNALVMRGWDLVFGKDRNNGLRAPKTSRLYDAIRAASEYILATRTTRRRALVVVTHNREAKSKAGQQTALDALLESSATLEAVVLPQESSAGGFTLGGVFRGGTRDSSRATRAPSFLDSLGSVDAFARESGGQTLRLDLTGGSRTASGPVRGADWAFDTIGPLVSNLMSRLRSQYMLGIRGAAAGEHQFRRLTVRLTDEAQGRYPNAIARSRAGYWTAAKGSTPKR